MLGRAVSLVALALFLSCSRSSDPEILSLGDQVVRRSDFERHVQALESKGGGAVDDTVRQALLDSFLEERILVLEARSRGMLAPKSTPEEEDEAVRKMLGDSILSKIEVSEDEIAQYYQEHSAELRAPETITLRQILVPTEAEARDIERRLLREPRDFDPIARKESHSPEASGGGLMGVFSRGELPPELERVAFGLATGAIQTVHTSLGYHVLKVDAREAARDRRLDECRDKIREVLSRSKADAAVHKFVTDLMSKAKVNHDAATPSRRS